MAYLGYEGDQIKVYDANYSSYEITAVDVVSNTNPDANYTITHTSRDITVCSDLRTRIGISVTFVAPNGDTKYLSTTIVVSSW